MSGAVRPPTPGQTVGPFFHTALPWPGDADVVDAGRPDAVRLRGVVRDGDGEPVPDALLELWQCDPAGRVVREPGSLRRPGPFTGFARVATDDTGQYAVTTLRPGPHAPDAAAFWAVAVLARGLLHRLLTRAYLPAGHGNDADALARDAVLRAAGARAATLLTTPEDDGYRFDVRLQGDAETVFLAFPGERAASADGRRLDP